MFARSPRTDPPGESRRRMPNSRRGDEVPLRDPAHAEPDRDPETERAEDLLAPAHELAGGTPRPVRFYVFSNSESERIFCNVYLFSNFSNFSKIIF